MNPNPTPVLALQEAKPQADVLEILRMLEQGVKGKDSDLALIK